MKISKIGDLNFKKYATEIYSTNEVIRLLDKEKISHSSLIPNASLWYEAELFPELDENGDGKPDEKFGYNFKIVYFLKEKLENLEKEAILRNTISLKGLKINYAGLKNA